MRRFAQIEVGNWSKIDTHDQAVQVLISVWNWMVFEEKAEIFTDAHVQVYQSASFDKLQALEGFHSVSISKHLETEDLYWSSHLGQ